MKICLDIFESTIQYHAKFISQGIEKVKDNVYADIIKHYSNNNYSIDKQNLLTLAKVSFILNYINECMIQIYRGKHDIDKKIYTNIFDKLKTIIMDNIKTEKDNFEKTICDVYSSVIKIINSSQDFKFDSKAPFPMPKYNSVFLLLNQLKETKYNMYVYNSNKNFVNMEFYINNDDNFQSICSNLVNVMKSHALISRHIKIEFDDGFSSGELAKISLLGKIDHIINSGNDTDKLILIDEIDTYIHPQWQVEIIDDTVNLLKAYDKNIQIIFTTHSPLVLSDLPDDYIIFIKNGNIKRIDQKTLSANVFDLYKNSFFLKNTMGDFALEKVNSVIKYINSLDTKEISDAKTDDLIKSNEAYYLLQLVAMSKNLKLEM